MPAVYAVKHVMSKPLITFTSVTTADEAIALMVEKNIGALIVTKEEKPVGIITERGILKNCCAGVVCRKMKVEES